METFIIRRKVENLNGILLPLHVLSGYDTDATYYFYMALSHDKTQIILKELQITDITKEIYRDIPICQTDKRGLLLIPDKLLFLLNIKQHTEFDIYFNDEPNSFVLRKIVPCCMLCGKTAELIYIKELADIRDSGCLCSHCIELAAKDRREL